jgi:3',5'-cyclic AMP phosphodiesterase CpdA
MKFRESFVFRAVLLFAVILISCTRLSHTTYEPSGKNKGDTLIIAVLGDSRSDGEKDSDGLNKRVLSKLLSGIKGHYPDAVFFTGDLTLGLEKEDEIEDTTGVKSPAPEWATKGFVYDNKEFKRILNVFSGILDSKLGSDIPFHPVIGNHEAVGPDAVSIFMEHFKIKNMAPVDSMHLAYTVELGKCLFVILATDYYSRETESLIEHKIAGGQKKWLAGKLKDSLRKYKFTFVLGHEPAFSVKEELKGKPTGLDRYPDARDNFWEILNKYKVSAYLCSHEHLYNKSKHDAVWQIISGGGGAPLEKYGTGSFYHFVIMKIPPGDGAVPRVTIIDLNGEVRDEFELN